jgi:hypothetical protein
MSRAQILVDALGEVRSCTGRSDTGGCEHCHDVAEAALAAYRAQPDEEATLRERLERAAFDARIYAGAHRAACERGDRVMEQLETCVAGLHDILGMATIESTEQTRIAASTLRAVGREGG